MPNAQPKRCAWVNVNNVLMREYHDREWGVPVHDDPRHFEFLILEAGGIRQLRRVLLAIRRRSAPTESLEDDASDPRHDARRRSATRHEPQVESDPRR